MNKSLYRLLIYIEKGSIDNFSELNAKSVDFPVTVEQMLYQTQVICRGKYRFRV